MSNTTFDFNVFIGESKDVLVNPKSYFSAMRTSGGLGEPLIKAVIYGAVAGFFAMLWSIAHLSVATGGMLGGGTGFMAFIWYIISAVIGMFIGAVIVLVLSAVAKGNTDFEACARVTASMMVLMPINAFLMFLTGLNLYLGLIVGLAINIYGIWLLYNALVYALKGKPETSRIIMYVLIILVVLFSLVGLGAKSKADKFMREFNNSEINR
jgi:hypothetical protein